MIITPNDVSLWVWCPRLYQEKRYSLVQPPLSPSERTLRNSIIEAEEKCLLKDSIVTPNKLLRVWDRLWWPEAIDSGIEMELAEKTALEQSFKLSDYCKYDFTDYVQPTVAVKTIGEQTLDSVLFRAEIDIVKVNIDKNKPHTILVDLSRKGLSQKDVVFDAGIRALASSFYTGNKETVTYINIDLDDKHKELKVLSANFRPDDIEQAKRMLYHIANGIRKKITYYNQRSCGECRLCQNFSF